jgi:hypothetical protein
MTGKECQIVELHCSSICEGTTDKYTDVLELKEKFLPILESLKGSNVIVTGEEHDYFYIGENDPEDQSHMETRFIGTILDVNINGIRLNIESGKKSYNQNNFIPVEKGELELPFYRHNYNYQKTADIRQIREIIVGDIIYRPISK